MSGFELFKRTEVRKARPLLVTVNRRRGTILIRSAAREAMTGTPFPTPSTRLAAVVFVIDRETGQWGIRPAKADDENAYAVGVAGLVTAPRLIRELRLHGEYRLERRGHPGGIVAARIYDRPIYPFWEALR